MDFPGGPVAKTQPFSAGDVGSIPGQGTVIPHAVEQLSPQAMTTEPAHLRAYVPQLEKPLQQRMRPSAAPPPTQKKGIGIAA